MSSKYSSQAFKLLFRRICNQIFDIYWYPGHDISTNVRKYIFYANVSLINLFGFLCIGENNQDIMGLVKHFVRLVRYFFLIKNVIMMMPMMMMIISMLLYLGMLSTRKVRTITAIILARWSSLLPDWLRPTELMLGEEWLNCVDYYCKPKKTTINFFFSLKNWGWVIGASRHLSCSDILGLPFNVIYTQLSINSTLKLALKSTNYV